MKLLIDTNVILDMVFKRMNCDISMELFRKIREMGMDAFQQKWKDYADALLPVLTPAACIEMINAMQKEKRNEACYDSE